MTTHKKPFHRPLVAAVTVLGALSLASFSAQARDLPAIQDDVFQVANSGAYPPFSYVDTAGNLVGFDVDIAEALADRMGVDVDIQTSPWNGIVAALAGGRFDACICSMSVTEERERAVDFTDSYYSSGLSVWVQEGNDEVSSIDDFAGKRVGSTLGETGNQWATENGDGKWRNQTFQGLPDMLNALTSGRIDVMIADDVPVYVALNEQDLAIKQVDVGELPSWPAAIAIQKNKPELKEALNTALAEIRADGTYQEIVDKWIGEGVQFD
ncbi:transporter substrate-binding domain-containing protein [Billgrantia kenyensis]|uniref:Transporter substrate-binding domain-containing protein n=1 Tax=Billgrantia kenyensis TaxID=321266 RepID=A0A7W0ADM8_9GAMM|nr:transporter substrate-binding domain-containing protein [Halomonas kenyensis]MBA2778675.1 transporter substrate-binding domain-containing protein [Halomonas kenyensis]MCG6661521.1 transporter substrate-binding domain-containing protein [Halomonas kenyensis]